MDLLQFRQDIDQADPDLTALLQLLDSMAPETQDVAVLTSLTCDTVNPWGNNNAQLERYFGGMHSGK